MLAIYYAIYEFDEDSQTRGEIIEDGILGENEETIYPGQTTGIKELPFECEVHHFKVPGYRIEMCKFSITREMVKKFRISGDKIK